MNKPDVVVIGGGVIGCAIAYYLTKRGARVTVLERDRIGDHASSAAAGMLGAQVETSFPGPMVDLCLASRRMFPDLQQELLQLTGLDIEWNSAGMLRLAMDERESGELQQRGEWQREIGEKAEWWSQEQLIQSEPALSSEVKGALHLPGDTQVSAPRLTRAFARGLHILGGKGVEGAFVTGLRVERGRVKEVETSAGSYRPEQVVLAAGVWTRSVARMAGVSLPVFPVKGESLSVQVSEPLFRKTLFGPGAYLVPKPDGQVIVGATERENDTSPGVTLEGLHRLSREALRMVPELSGGNWERSWAGFRPGSPDGLPYLGRVKELSNLYVASGHFRNGILLSPVTGRGMADLLAGLEVPEFHPFSPERGERVTQSGWG
ncbi:glycine oxidase ThiO [Paludifilum halophilum]|uniref:glycine oxidase n=1 Tax=Paludifilum halophilum TaxID=1642702 RepID=A0A235B5X4_9BACL|nr:glycine oxidase ThiO [Paludifilum halophilum]OYD07706.1 glycine oxidase ThiO [Paludifilum halophilum]